MKYRENYLHLKCLAIIFAKFPPNENNHVYSTFILFLLYPLTGIATMTMCRPPVNSLNLELLTQLTISLEKLENSKDVTGLVITSVSNKTRHFIREVTRTVRMSLVSKDTVNLSLFMNDRIFNEKKSDPNWGWKFRSCRNIQSLKKLSITSFNLFQCVKQGWVWFSLKPPQCSKRI